jgi:flavin reductase (DIM6/NTAB) family NADH-FMN oxidoreductase RutF
MKQSRGARTIVYPTPVFIVGTYDAEGRPNMMAAAWGGMACSRPPAVTVALRAATLTHGNIVARQAFTVSIPSEAYVEAADYVGIISGRDADKFAETGLTPVGSELVDAPYVAEFPLVLECSLLHTLEIGLHTLFVGEILDVKAEVDVLNAEGKVAIEKVRPLIFAPDGGGYFGVGDYLGPAFEIGRRIKDRSR